MAELIYNVNNIFSEDKGSCLTEYDANMYYIPAYQRGYKWDSDENGAVSILLQDLFNAFVEKRKEYYLQYITLKKVEKVLEVIDGQQRLTTLSILLSVISKHLNKKNITEYKLDYTIRTNFLKKYIYNQDNLSTLLQLEWDEENGLVFENKSINNQDVYYIFQASKKIDSFCKEKQQSELESFYNFILNQVKIIVNVVDHISSEKVFGNLNSNKVLLSEAELIKGLILTKISRRTEEKTKKHFREILEMRLSLGRQWDEITQWCNQPEIKSFFFAEKKDGMKQLLTLVAVSLGYKEKEKQKQEQKELFNFYHEKITDVKGIYEQILKLYFTLKDWYENDEIYNLLGFLFFYKGSEKAIKDFINELDTDKESLIKLLIDQTDIPQNPKELHFGEHNNEIHKILLALNVFSNGENYNRFDFYSFKDKDWTLEHIFPQKFGGKGKPLGDKDKQLIFEMLEKEEVENLKKELSEKLFAVEDVEEEEKILQEALKKSTVLNNIGNMCLLTRGDNASNGCGFFDEKRVNVLKLIKKGNFVPKHTFDVFSKMIITEDTGDYKRWTRTNIEQHADAIENIISNLKFKKQ